MFFAKRRRREIVALNVVALIDISSLIIIFLIMGSVFGESSVNIPNGMAIPKSVSKETVENAPSLTIADNEVRTTFGVSPISIESFRKQSDDLKGYRASLKQFVDSIPPEGRQSGVLINVIADKATPYSDIFDVVKVFRESGFQSMLFIAQGK